MRASSEPDEAVPRSPLAFAHEHWTLPLTALYFAVFAVDCSFRDPAALAVLAVGFFHSEHIAPRVAAFCLPMD